MTTTIRKTGFSTDALIRWSGLAAVAAGIIFAAIQPIHPLDLLASVTTSAWTIIISLKFVMCLLFMVGIAGIYARQADKAGWLGFAGFALLTFCWWLQTGYVFTEGFILPVIAETSPGFIDSFFRVVNPASPAGTDIGALPAAYGVIGITYMLGGLLFGIATVRAKAFPRWPALLLAIAATLTPLAALLPHEVQRYAAVPVALAIAWLGYTLWSMRSNASPSEFASGVVPAAAE